MRDNICLHGSLSHFTDVNPLIPFNPFQFCERSWSRSCQSLTQEIWKQARQVTPPRRPHLLTRISPHLVFRLQSAMHVFGFWIETSFPCFSETCLGIKPRTFFAQGLLSNHSNSFTLNPDIRNCWNETLKHLSKVKYTHLCKTMGEKSRGDMINKAQWCQIYGLTSFNDS